MFLFALKLVAEFALGCVLDVVLSPVAKVIKTFTTGLIY